MSVILLQIVALFLTFGLAAAHACRGHIRNWADQSARQQLMALLRLISIILIAGLVLLVCTVFGVTLGVVMLLAWLLVAEIVGNTNFIWRLAGAFCTRFNARLISIGRTLAPGLMLIADRQPSVPVTIHSADELLRIAAESGVLDQSALDSLHQTFESRAVRISDVMTPRARLITLRPGDIMGPLLLDKLHKTKRTEFPVTEGSLDHIVGIVSLRYLVELKELPETVGQTLLTQPVQVREDLSVLEALNLFLQTGQHLFIVVNDSGRTVGAVGINDIIHALHVGAQSN